MFAVCINVKFVVRWDCHVNALAEKRNLKLRAQRKLVHAVIHVKKCFRVRCIYASKDVTKEIVVHVWKLLEKIVVVALIQKNCHAQNCIYAIQNVNKCVIAINMHAIENVVTINVQRVIKFVAKHYRVENINVHHCVTMDYVIRVI